MASAPYPFLKIVGYISISLGLMKIVAAQPGCRIHELQLFCDLEVMSLSLKLLFIDEKIAHGDACKLHVREGQKANPL